MWRASNLYWIVQFIGWSLFCSLLAFTQLITGDVTLVFFIQLSLLYFLLIVLSHVGRLIILRFNWMEMKMAYLIPRVISLNLIIAGILVLLTWGASYIFFELRSETRNFADFLVNTLGYSLFFTLWTAVYLTYYLIKKSRNQEIQHLKLEASHHESELKTLRDQLNPHFLFNALNSIRALIGIDQEQAKFATTTLSKLLRRSLQMGKNTFIPLKEEIELVKEYLEIEKIRFEERLNVVYQIDESIHYEIPPFIIQTLAENAIKHGISNSKKGGDIVIEINQRNNSLNIKVSNTGSLVKADGEGIGLVNTKKRLLLHYGTNASLELREIAHEKKVIAEIIIKFDV